MVPETIHQAIGRWPYMAKDRIIGVALACSRSALARLKPGAKTGSPVRT